MRLLRAIAIAVTLCMSFPVSAQAKVKAPSLSTLQKVSSPGQDACALVSLPDSSAPVCSAAEKKAFSDLYSANDILDCSLVLNGPFNWCDSTCLAAYGRVAASSPKCRSSSEFTLKTLYTYALCSCKAARADTVGKYIPVKATAESANCTSAEVSSWVRAYDGNATYMQCVDDMTWPTYVDCPARCKELFEEGVRAAPKCREYKGRSYFTMDEKSKEPLVKCLQIRKSVVTSNALLKSNGSSSSSKSVGDQESSATLPSPTPTPTPTATSGALPVAGSMVATISCVILSIASQF